MITKISAGKNLSDQLIRLEIRISEKFEYAGPGQYVILRTLAENASVTCPVFKYEPTREILTVLVPVDEDPVAEFIQATEATSEVEMEGSFGQPFRIGNSESVLCVASYNCMIPLLPVILALRAAGNKITCLLTQNPGINHLPENEIRKNSDHWIATDENQRRSFQLLEQTIRVHKFDQVIAIGHTRTIRETSTICTATRTPVQLMLCLPEQNLRGKHGIFRVNVYCKTHSVCVDGYNFNAHYLGFDEVAKRFGSETSALKTAGQLAVSI
ncbi:MAG TPA: hypothetical protein PLG33_03485 [Prolixibacteraceae bacterium]|nr:hypothetical protein [Prolixibacteraceae bacterium]HPR85087.1 hypothetical protein [Prolixibacteraceae bacterium]